MTSHLIDIGNSKAISIPKKLIEKYKLENEIELKPLEDGIFISRKRKPREGWGEQIKRALQSGEEPEEDSLENITSEWDNVEWTWPE
jgi:antitoxin component of MazEF toxin-antitoxin module